MGWVDKLDPYIEYKNSYVILNTLKRVGVYDLVRGSMTIGSWPYQPIIYVQVVHIRIKKQGYGEWICYQGTMCNLHYRECS